MQKPSDRFVLVSVALILSFVLLSPRIANAEPIVIDQISPIADNVGITGLGCCIDADWAQTFTVGITGVLRNVALPLSLPALSSGDDFSGQLGVQLRSTVGGVPSESVLAQMILAKSSLPSAADPTVRNEFTTFFSGLNIPIVSGEQLAIVFSNVGHNGQNIRLAVNGLASYTGGAPSEQPRQDTGMAGDRGNVTGPWERPRCCQDFDFAFFTQVEPGAPAATPEPGTVLLLGTGLLCVVRRRVRPAQVR